MAAVAPWRGSFAVAVSNVLYWHGSSAAIPMAVAPTAIARLAVKGDKLVAFTETAAVIPEILSPGVQLWCRPSKRRITLSGRTNRDVQFAAPYAPQKAVVVGGDRVLLLLENCEGHDAIVPIDLRSGLWGAPLLTAYFIADFALNDRGALAAVASMGPVSLAPRLIKRQTGWRPRSNILHPRAAAALAVARLLPLPAEIVELILGFVHPCEFGNFN